MATININSSRNLVFQNSELANYWRDRLRTAVTNLSDSDQLQLQISLSAGGIGVLRYQHDGSWTPNTHVDTSTNQVLINHVAGETVLNNMSLNTSYEYDSIAVFSAPVGSSTFLNRGNFLAADSWQGITSNTGLTIVFNEIAAATSFVDTITNDTFSYDREITSFIRFPEQSSSAAAINFVGLNFSPAGIGTVARNSNQVTFTPATGITYANSYTNNTVRPFTSVAYFDSDNDATFVTGSPRINPNAGISAAINHARGLSRAAGAGMQSMTSGWAGEANLMRPGGGAAPSLRPLEGSRPVKPRF